MPHSGESLLQCKQRLPLENSFLGWQTPGCPYVPDRLPVFCGRHLDVLTFQITYQLKIVAAMIASRLLLNKRAPPLRW